MVRQRGRGHPPERRPRLGAIAGGLASSTPLSDSRSLRCSVFGRGRLRPRACTSGASTSSIRTPVSPRRGCCRSRSSAQTSPSRTPTRPPRSRWAEPGARWAAKLPDHGAIVILDDGTISYSAGVERYLQDAEAPPRRGGRRFACRSTETVNDDRRHAMISGKETTADSPHCRHGSGRRGRRRARRDLSAQRG